MSIFLFIAGSSFRPVPEGTKLHVRLVTAVGSYASKPGSPVRAVLIAPLIIDGKTVLRPGSMLAGRVKSVTRVGYGVRHETAGLSLEFNQLTPLDGESISISTQLFDVDNSRERVARNGRIQGVRSTSSLSYRISGYLRTALHWEPHGELLEWAIKSLITQLPEPEIYYPAGVELTLALNHPLPLEPLQSVEQQAAPELTGDEREDLARLVSVMPDQTRAPGSDRSSDLTNVLLIGSRDQIVTAFSAAGWTQPGAATLRDRIHWLRAIAELRGDEAAPMSLLLLDGMEPDMSWEKGLNDVSKRHHIRLWKAASTWEGREMWIGAATRDVDFAYLRPGRKLSHKIDGNIDQERDKVAYDLAFSSCAAVLDWTDRPDMPRFTRNATGDPIVTDGRMAVVDLNDCDSPRYSTETTDLEPVPEHGTKLQRFARREILSARNDLLRTNPYWRSFEAARWVVESVRRRHRASQELFAVSSPAVNSAAPFSALIPGQPALAANTQ